MYTKTGINKKTDELFMDSIPYTPIDEEISKKKGRIYSILNLYTIYRDRFFTPFLIRDQFKNIKHDKKNEVEHYDDEDYSFVFSLLSDRVIGNRKLKRDLKSDRRYHRCHEAAIGFSLNDDEGTVKILSGYMPCLDSEFHHSVIQISEDGLDLIIDFTQNIVMEKDKFIEIFDFRVVNEISSKVVKEDNPIMIELGIKDVFYLFFRDEIMRDINKNIKILKP